MYIHTAVVMCRSDLFYHMTAFHNFDIGDPYNLGMFVIVLTNFLTGFLAFLFILSKIIQPHFPFCVAVVEQFITLLTFSYHCYYCYSAC